MQPYSGAGNSYKQQDVMTASPGELTLRLFKGGIKNLKLFKQDVEKKDYGAANMHSQKTQNIIVELMRSLDMRYNVAKQLLPLYTFLLDTIVNSNVKKDIEQADIAIQMLSELQDTWQEAMSINRQEQFGSHVNTV